MRKIVALFLVFAMCFSFAACNSKNKICSECKEKLVGDWFSVDEIETGTVEKIITITDDAKLIVDGKTHTLCFDCGFKHSSGATAYGNDGDWEYIINFNHDTVNYLFDDSIVLKDNKAITKEYRPMNKYSVVEITEDNWQEYFSPNFKENFDVNYKFDTDKDAWGEVTSVWISEEFTVKNIDKYVYGSNVTLEYSYEVGRMKYDFDASGNKVINTSYTSSDATIHKKTSLLRCDVYSVDEKTTHMDMGINGVRVYKEDISKGTCEGVYENPIEILRMKGYLIIKNDI